MFELFNKGLISKKTLLILNYAKLQMNEFQLAIILLIMEKSDHETRSFTPTQLAQFMSITNEQIDQELSSLIDNNLVKIEQKNRKSVINLTPLFTKILITLEEESSLNNQTTDFDYLENIFSSKLTVEQKTQLDGFIEKGISNQKIKAILFEKQINSFTELIKELNSILKNNEPLKVTIYNWLND